MVTTSIACLFGLSVGVFLKEYGVRPKYAYPIIVGSAFLFGVLIYLT